MVAKPGSVFELKCPIVNCENSKMLDQVMCRSHWYRVSAPTRARVWRLYRSQPMSPEHIDAMMAAVDEAT